MRFSLCLAALAILAALALGGCRTAPSSGSYASASASAFGPFGLP